MADPFSWAGIAAAGSAIAPWAQGIGTAASIAGGAIGASGALAKGSSDKAMYGYQSGVALLNQNIAKQNASYARDIGEGASAASGRKTMATISSEKIAQAANGFDVNSGTPASVRQSTQDIGYIDQSTIRQNYAKKAYSYEVEAATRGTEAKADIIAGEQSEKVGKIGAASSILGSVSSVSSKWLQGSSAFGGANSGITLYDENQQAVGWRR